MPDKSRNVLVIFASFILVSALVIPSLMDIQSIAAVPDNTSDFNGDGYSDLAVGLPFEDVYGKVDAGAVNVIYGSPSGLAICPGDVFCTTTFRDQFWHQNVANVEDSIETGDNFGAVLTTGDFNNDGKSDLAISVPNEDVGSIIDAGAVQVLYGSSSGLSATNRPDQIFTQ
jgi:FG-GAP repeat